MEYRYDVFISYKHTEVDSAVARGLQKKLEHYRVPREIQRAHGKKNIRRVFRDQEELSVGYDLAAEIEEQLKTSEFLVVLCSRASRQSLWVAKEVDTFLKYHSPRNILPILIDGEPEESFPVRLLEEGEPFAADIRGDSKKAVLKKLESEVYRIIAPVLYCHYDELIQRHKRYRLQRTLMAAVAAFVLLSGFTAYVIRQSMKDRAAMMTQLLSESRILTREATDYLDHDDNLTATEYLLQALPDPTAEDSITRERPFYPPALEQLTKTLNIYKTPEAVNGENESTAIYENDAEIRGMQLAKDERYLIATDEFHVHVLDAATMTECCTYTYDNYSLLNSRDDVIFIDETRMLIEDRYELICYDYTQGRILWRSNFRGFYDCVFAEATGRVHVLIKDDRQLFTLDAATGHERASVSLDLNTTYLQLQDVSDSGEELLLYYRDADSRLPIAVVYDTRTGGFSPAYPLDIAYSGIRFSPDPNRILMMREPVSENNEVSCYIACYDRTRGSIVWEHTFPGVMPGVSYGFSYGKDTYKGNLYAYYGHALAEIDLSDGSLLREYPLDGSLKSITFEDDLLLVVTSQGSYFTLTDEIAGFDGDQSQIQGLMYWDKFSAGVLRACRDKEKVVYLQTEENRIFRYAGAPADDRASVDLTADYSLKYLNRVAGLAGEDYSATLYQYDYNGVYKQYYALIAKDHKSGRTLAFTEEDLLPFSPEASTVDLTPTDTLGTQMIAMSEEELSQKRELRKEYEESLSSMSEDSEERRELAGRIAHLHMELADYDHTSVRDILPVSLDGSLATFLVSFLSYRPNYKYAVYRVTIDLATCQKTTEPLYLVYSHLPGDRLLYQNGDIYTCLTSYSPLGVRIVKTDGETGDMTVIPVSAHFSATGLRVIASRVRPVFYIIDKNAASLNIIDAATGAVTGKIRIADYTFHENDPEELVLSESDSGDVFAVAEQGGIHVFAGNGTALCDISYERPIGEEKTLSDILGGLSIDPENKYLYYAAFGSLYRCRLGDGEVTDRLELPGTEDGRKVSLFRYGTFSFDGGKSQAPVLDILFEGISDYSGGAPGTLYRIYPEDSSFHSILRADYVYDLDPDRNRILTVSRNIRKHTCTLSSYPEYTYEELITMGKEKIGNED